MRIAKILLQNAYVIAKPNIEYIVKPKIISIPSGRLSMFIDVFETVNFLTPELRNKLNMTTSCLNYV